jgi:hypothetical protein
MLTILLPRRARSCAAGTARQRQVVDEARRGEVLDREADGLEHGGLRRATAVIPPKISPASA